MGQNNIERNEVVAYVKGVKMLTNGVFTFPRDEDVTGEVIQAFIDLHVTHLLPTYLENENMYLGKHDILNKRPTADGKPNNMIVTNFAKYIVDTYNGYFIGIPVKTSIDDEATDALIQGFTNISDLDDNFAELSKIMAIYGRGYAFMYQGEDAETYLTYNNPTDMFVVYDDTVAQKPLFAVRFWRNDWEDNTVQGEVYMGNMKYEYHYSDQGTILNDGTVTTNPSIPIIEFIENEERYSVFEPVKSLINAYNKALSEKADDLEYFADAYMYVLNALIDKKSIGDLHKNRLMQVKGDGSNNVQLGFLERPDSDGTQEHFLDRVQNTIYEKAMVANISDKDFGTNSGIALEYKMESMKNLAINKERKFTTGLREVFKYWFSVPRNVSAGMAGNWYDVSYKFTRNQPRNVSDEITAAKNADGILSEETRLGLISIVENVQEEMERLADEKEENMKNMIDAGMPTIPTGDNPATENQEAGTVDGNVEKEV